MINIILFALFTNLILTNIIINFFHQLNIKQYVLTDAPPSHMEKQGTVTMGGVAIIITIFIWLIVKKSYLNFSLIATMLVLTGYSIIGLIDDLSKIMKHKNKGLTARAKLALQIMFACAFVGLLAGSNHFAGASELLQMYGPIPYYLGLIFLVVGFSNAVNLTDGLDGLAAGTLVMAFLGLLFFSFIQMNASINILLLIIIGSLLGFLWFNVNPAKIFMGDTGSLSLGAVFAAIGIILHKELGLVLLGLVFVIETLSVMLQVSFFKLTKGKRIFKMSPIHHHFELSGWTENKIVIRFWIFGVIFLLLTIKFF